MKLFKTVFAATAIAAMLSSCNDIEEMSKEDLARKGILKNTVTLYNSAGSKASGIDCTVNAAEGISGKITYTEGATNIGTVAKDSIASIAYADNKKIDFKVKINKERGATVTYITKLTSLNSTMYKSITTAEYEKTSLRDLKKAGDAATLTEIAFPLTKDSCFVAKLGGDRGYALARITKFEKDFEGASTLGHNGLVEIQYYQIPADSLK